MFVEDFGPGADRARLVKKLTRLYANKYKIYLDKLTKFVYTISTKRKRGQNNDKNNLLRYGRNNR